MENQFSLNKIFTEDVNYKDITNSSGTLDCVYKAIEQAGIISSNSLNESSLGDSLYRIKEVEKDISLNALMSAHAYNIERKTVNGLQESVITYTYTNLDNLNIPSFNKLNSILTEAYDVLKKYDNFGTPDAASDVIEFLKESIETVDNSYDTITNDVLRISLDNTIEPSNFIEETFKLFRNGSMLESIEIFPSNHFDHFKKSDDFVEKDCCDGVEDYNNKLTHCIEKLNKVVELLKSDKANYYNHNSEVDYHKKKLLKKLCKYACKYLAHTNIAYAMKADAENEFLHPSNNPMISGFIVKRELPDFDLGFDNDDDEYESDSELEMTLLESAMDDLRLSSEDYISESLIEEVVVCPKMESYETAYTSMMINEALDEISISEETLTQNLGDKFKEAQQKKEEEEKAAKEKEEKEQKAKAEQEKKAAADNAKAKEAEVKQDIADGKVNPGEATKKAEEINNTDPKVNNNNNNNGQPNQNQDSQNNNQQQPANAQNGADTQNANNTNANNNEGIISTIKNNISKLFEMMKQALSKMMFRIARAAGKYSSIARNYSADVLAGKVSEAIKNNKFDANVFNTTQFIGVPTTASNNIKTFIGNLRQKSVKILINPKENQDQYTTEYFWNKITGSNTANSKETWEKELRGNNDQPFTVNQANLTKENIQTMLDINQSSQMNIGNFSSTVQNMIQEGNTWQNTIALEAYEDLTKYDRAKDKMASLLEDYFGEGYKAFDEDGENGTQQNGGGNGAASTTGNAGNAGTAPNPAAEKQKVVNSVKNYVNVFTIATTVVGTVLHQLYAFNDNVIRRIAEDRMTEAQPNPNEQQPQNNAEQPANTQQQVQDQQQKPVEGNNGATNPTAQPQGQ